MKTTPKMQAAVITAPMQARIETVAVAEPGAGTVRVRLEGCGVCGSNLPPWEGRPWFQYPLAPGELGHEGWGRVEAVGPEVTQVAVGDRVALLSYRAYAEYDLAPEDAVVRLPPALDKMPFPAEALGCAMNVFRRCEIQPGHTVAIVGIGFLGALLTALAAKAGAKVIAVSRRLFTLKMARRLGAMETILLDGHWRIIDEVKNLTGGQGCDCVIEAVGKQGPLNVAADLTREQGRLVIAGFHQDGLRQINLQDWNWRGLEVINAHERDPKVYVAGMRAAIAAVTEGVLDPSLLYTHTFRLDQIAEALNCLRDRPDSFLKGLVFYE